MSVKSSVEWADKTWNPINGRCPNQCIDLDGEEYCWMWRPRGGLGNRFKEIHDHPIRLDEKVLERVPKKGRIAVGIDTDMWVDEVPDEWIERVLWECRFASRWGKGKDDGAEFLFLTKKPKRYLQMPLDRIHWYGTTWDGTDKTRDNIYLIAEFANMGYDTFISFEPLLVNPEDKRVTLDYSEIRWVIIGADSRRGKPKPPKEWADYLIADARRNGAKVFIKDNYGYPEIIKEIPDEN